MSFIRHRRATSPNKFEYRNYDSHTQHFDTSAVRGGAFATKIYNMFIGSVGVEFFAFLSGIGLYFSMVKDSNVLHFFIRE